MEISNNLEEAIPSESKDQDQINEKDNSLKYLQDEIRICGILEANAKHWRTMPDFKTMFSSKKDIFMFLFNLFLLGLRYILLFLQNFINSKINQYIRSIYDVVSDFLTGLEYFEGQSFTENVRYLNDTKVANLTSSYFLNATARICRLEENGTYNFSCVEHHYWYGTMTFVFIYATSGMTLASLIGRKAAYVLCVSWGIILGIVGLIFTYTGESVEIVVQGLFMIFLGTILFWGPVLSFVVGLADKSVMEDSARFSNQDTAVLGPLLIFLPLVILVSPILMVIIHTLAIFRPESKFIQAQKKEVKKGESILEATPQLILQMFVAMRTMHPSWKQQASIITSCLSICIADAESYLDKKYGIEFGLNMTSLKCFLAHVPSS